LCHAQTISTVAGNGSSSFSGDGGPATGAALMSPYGVAVDTNGNIFIADYLNNRIRKVDTSGVIATVAGCGAISTACAIVGLGDGGPATAPLTLGVWDVVVDNNGNFYFTDSGNTRIRKVNASGIISTVAGGGKDKTSEGIAATSAQLQNPVGLAIDGAGNIYVAEVDGNRVRKIDTSGIINTVAGNGKQGFSGDGGPATSAMLGNPHGVATDSAGNLYITDTVNFRVRKVSSGIITTIAGDGTVGNAVDNVQANKSPLASPWDVRVDIAGNVYISDWLHNRVRKVDGSGIITTIAGTGAASFSGDGGPGTSAALNAPTGLALDNAGNIYVVDNFNNRIRKIGAPPPPTPSISANGVLNGASFLAGIVPNSWATIKGTNLASTTDTWANAIINGALPTSLDGVKVSVAGSPAYIYFISPGQINFIVPPIPPGPAQVTVTTAGGTSPAVSATVTQYAPAFFTWPGNQAVATRQDFTYAVKDGTFPGTTTVAAKPGDVIILWATGLGATIPAAPAGVQVPSTATYSTSSVPSVTLNNLPATVYGAALAPGYAGLYQVAIQVPTSLADGDWPIVMSIGGVSSPSSVVLSVKH